MIVDMLLWFFSRAVKTIKEATFPLYCPQLSSWVTGTADWQVGNAFFRPGALPAFGSCHYLCFVCQWWLHACNEYSKSLPIKIIASSRGFLSAKLHQCPNELCDSRQLTEWRTKAGILIVSKESASYPSAQTSEEPLYKKDDAQIKIRFVENVAVN